MFLNYFDMLILKIILKNKKIYYFDILSNKTHFKNIPNIYPLGFCFPSSRGMLEKIEPICQNICVPVAASFISLPLVFFQN